VFGFCDADVEEFEQGSEDDRVRAVSRNFTATSQSRKMSPATMHKTRTNNEYMDDEYATLQNYHHM
jgi:hypothetical protein